MEKTDQIELTASTRKVLGKKVRFLRREGVTPVNMYGHGFKSVALQVDTPQLKEVLARAGRTSLVALKVNKEKEHKLVMFRNIQKDPLSGEIVHVDLYHIRAGQKIKVQIPLRIVGESPAVKLHGGVLYQNFNSLQVECLATALVSSLEVDISGLAEIDQAIMVKDMKVPEGVAVLAGPDQLVVKVIAPRAEVVEAAPVAEAAEEKAEGEEGAEGEEKAGEGGKEAEKE